MAGQQRVKRQRGDELEFLPAALEVLETPPHPAARVTAIVVCAFFLAAVVWACLGFIDTVAIADGQIVPTDRVKLIQPLETGIVRAIHVRDGQRVAAGDVLVELDPTDAQTNVEALRSDLIKAQLDSAVSLSLLDDVPGSNFLIPEGASGSLAEAARAQLAGEVEKLKAQLALVAADLEEQRASLLSYQSQLKKAEDTTPLVEERLKGLEDLHGKNLVRKPELFATRQQRIEVLSDASTAGSGIKQVEARISSRRHRETEIRATFRAEALQRRADALRRAASFEQQLIKESQRQADRRLRAPAAGTIVGLDIHTVGGVVGTKDVSMRLVPAGASLELECFIKNQDIGFVSEGQPVEIKFETFPFTRYGLIEGEVVTVWRDAIEDQKRGLVYKALVRLKSDRIRVGSAWVPIAPGMAAQAEIKTGYRRLIEYFLSPFIRYRDEALRER